jgi:hypothetical protein
MHFEDLDPHRFEDLVRELVYDYKDWQNIEATGRGGSDDGFDIRAIERASSFESDHDRSTDDDAAAAAHPMSGNIWMIQVKREAEIGPKRVREIVQDVDPANPPYGYILAASANFSKVSYDAFREELRAKNVMEFHLWGKAELEDMLHQPKNDRLLFAFFGVSLATRRRSRATEARSTVLVKNRLLKIFGDRWEGSHSVLVRDLADAHYPDEHEYQDFKTKPRWKEYSTVSLHPTGLVVAARRHFAYVDQVKKQWDFTRVADLTYRQSDSDEDRKQLAADRELVEGFYQYLPRANQATFCVNGLIEFENITLVDEKGDALHPFPHIYAEYHGDKGPFAGAFEYLEVSRQRTHTVDDYTRAKVFPDEFTGLRIGSIRAESLRLSPEVLAAFERHDLDALFDDDGRYSSYKQGDVVGLDGTERDLFILFTFVVRTTVGAYLGTVQDRWKCSVSMRSQLGTDLSDEREIGVYEFQRIYRWKLNQLQKTGHQPIELP